MKVFTKQTLILAALLPFFATGAAAQVSRYDNWVQLPNGQAVAGAVVTVCSWQVLPTVVTAPCSPAINIYNDYALTQLITPQGTITTDQGGNYGWFINATNYVYTVTGGNFAPIGRYVTPGSGGSGVNILPLSNNFTGAVNMFQGVVVNASLNFPNLAASSALCTDLSKNATTTGCAAGGSPPVGSNNDIQIKNGSLFGSGVINPANVGVAGNIFAKPSCTGVAGVDSGIRYADYNGGGSDSNDGCSWGSAKQTIRGALVSLPGGSTSPDSTSSGVVYYTDGTPADLNGTGCGLWLIGPNDPNFASPPSCWIKYGGGSGALTIVGLPLKNYGPNPHKGRSLMGGGSSVDRYHPGLWLSGMAGTLYFENMAFEYPARSIVIGECSNHTRTGVCNVSGVTFDNTTGNLNSVTGNGPDWDITGQSYWIWLNDCGASGTDSVNPGLGDLAPAILIDGRTNSGSGLIFINDANLSGGGIKLYNGGNGGQVIVHNLTTEGQTGGEAAVWLADGGAGNTFVTANISDVEVADATTTTPGVQVDVNGTDVVVSNIQGQNINVVGPATVLSQYRNNFVNLSESPLRQGQTGFFNGHVVGQDDNIGRSFSPTTVRYPNLASTSPLNWTVLSGTATITEVTDMTGKANAGHIVYGSGGQPGTAMYYAANTPVVIGDSWMFSAWIRSATANGYSGNTPIEFLLNANGYGTGDYCNGSTTSIIVTNGLQTGDGNWERVWGICNVTANPTNAGIALVAYVDSTHTLEVFAPTLIHVTNGTVSANEAYAIAAALPSYSNLCTVGQICGINIPPSIDCTRYPGATVDVSINACIADVITNGGGIADARGFYGNQTIAQQITVGNSSHAKVTLLLPTVGTWTTASGFTGTTTPGPCALFEWGQSRIESQGPVLGLRIQNGSGNGTLAALFCHEALSGGDYFYVKGINFYNVVYTTSSGGTFLTYGADDTSVFEDLQIDDYVAGDTGAILLTQTSTVSGDCCSATFNRIQTNAQYTGPPGVNINGTSTGSIIGVVFNNSSFTHPKSGSPAILCSDTNTTHASTAAFNNTYEETSNLDTTTAINQVNGCRSVSFNGGLTIRAQVASDVAPAVSISNAFPSSVTIDNLVLTNTWTFPNTSAIQTNVTSAACPSPPCNYPSDSHGNVSRYSSNIAYADVTATGLFNQTAAGRFASTATLSGGTVTVTFPTAYSSTPVCIATDQTNADAVKAAPTASTLVLTGNSTDVIAWLCVGNPN
jgi:hypothetical protein